MSLSMKMKGLYLILPVVHDVNLEPSFPLFRSNQTTYARVYTILYVRGESKSQSWRMERIRGWKVQNKAGSSRGRVAWLVICNYRCKVGKERGRKKSVA